jgi:NAD(P)-dependent dehydrogenase (short-subunit alcohol dehydrogenase family)
MSKERKRKREREQAWVVVTGASSGIGEETVRTLQKSGFSVIATARTEKTLQRKFGSFENVEIIPWDLSDMDSVRDYSKAVFDKVGAIHGIIHCAGIQKIIPVHMIKEDKILDMFSINTFAAMALVASFSKKKMSGQDASFVLISSLSAHEGVAGSSAYAASKAALEGFATAVAPELAEREIRINCIAPGMIDTPMLNSYMAQLTEEQFNHTLSEYPLGIGEPADIASFAEYLISDKAKWITGQTFIIDGGHLIRK